MASVYFKCSCAKSLAVDASGAGSQVLCPDCGKLLFVPSSDLSWTCACGEEMSAPKNLAGVTVRCAACAAQHVVPVRLGLKRDRPAPQDQPVELSPDVPRVPVGRNNDIRCPKCGYRSPPVLARCPRCHRYLRKGAVIRRRCISAAKVIFIIGLGWFLASHFSRISEYVKSLFGLIFK